MRTLTVLLCVSFIAITMAGCGKTDQPAPKPSSETPATPPTAPTATAPAAQPVPPPPDQDTPPPAEVADPGKALFELSCNKCHAQKKAEAYAGTETWQAIVDRMITKHGAEVKAEDAANIVAYLDKTFPRK